MSLFLGRIHYWLFNKILWFESLETEIIQSFREHDKDIDDLVEHINVQFGPPVGDVDLEDIIDTSNIHGWLQQKIESAELRHAALVSQLVKWRPSNKARILEICEEHGEAAAREYSDPVNTPEEIFNALNDYILEGMPCDRVNEIVDNSEDELAWRTTTCLHKPYWKRICGEVQNFYDLREAWVKSFINAINADFRYEKSADGINRIVRN